MLSALFRFHGHGSLRTVYRNGRTVRGPLMSLKYAERRSKTGFRAAVVVSKKVHKSAVTRNRIRRRVYEVVRNSDGQLTVGKDLVLTVFSERVAEIDHSKLAAMVEDLLQKAAGKGGTTAVDRGIVKSKGES